MPDLSDPAEAMQHWYHLLRDELRAGGGRSEEMVLYSLIAAEVRGLGRLLVLKGLAAPEDWQRSMAGAFEQEHSELVNATGRYAPDGGAVLDAERSEG